MLWAIEERCDEMEWKIIVIFYSRTVACRKNTTRALELLTDLAFDQDNDTTIFSLFSGLCFVFCNNNWTFCCYFYVSCVRECKDNDGHTINKSDCQN